MTNNFRRIESCRICGNREFDQILDLGKQFLTGVFPKTLDDPVTRGPLELVKCSPRENTCGLVQLRHSYEPGEMYGPNYGYRSSLNRSMADHLAQKVESLCRKVELDEGDFVLDIGSNDGTTLSFYPSTVIKVGMDPTADRFQRYYGADVRRISEFFSAKKFSEDFGNQKVKIVTSIAMFYDLDDPQQFVNEVAGLLDDDGIWHLEQSYMPRMLETTGYDTICHEHVEYYGLRQIEWMLRRAGLRIIDVELNDVNGGSFAVTACRQSSSLPSNIEALESVRDLESRLELDTMTPFTNFAERVSDHRRNLIDLIDNLVAQGKTVLGYGASTKGNVILQYCGFDTTQIPFIAEVNQDKFGCVTPGTGIPIIPEAVARSRNPDYFLVMPWHFKSNIVEREAAYLESGGRLIFPLPSIEVIG